VHLRFGVIPIATHGRDLGIDTSRLRLQIEGRLTSVGLVVSDTASAEFWVRVTVLAIPGDLFIDGLDMQLIDEVATTRRVTSGPFRAPVWGMHSTGTVGQTIASLPGRVTTYVMGTLSSIFLPRYRAANPPGR
jgi:hypothetical protein